MFWGELVTGDCTPLHPPLTYGDWIRRVKMFPFKGVGQQLCPFLTSFKAEPPRILVRRTKYSQYSLPARWAQTPLQVGWKWKNSTYRGEIIPVTHVFIPSRDPSSRTSCPENPSHVQTNHDKAARLLSGFFSFRCGQRLRVWSKHHFELKQMQQTMCRMFCVAYFSLRTKSYLNILFSCMLFEQL